MTRHYIPDMNVCALCNMWMPRGSEAETQRESTEMMLEVRSRHTQDIDVILKGQSLTFKTKLSWLVERRLET